MANSKDAELIGKIIEFGPSKVPNKYKLGVEYLKDDGSQGKQTWYVWKNKRGTEEVQYAFTAANEAMQESRMIRVSGYATEIEEGPLAGNWTKTAQKIEPVSGSAKTSQVSPTVSTVATSGSSVIEPLRSPGTPSLDSLTDQESAIRLWLVKSFGDRYLEMTTEPKRIKFFRDIDTLTKYVVTGDPTYEVKIEPAVSKPEKPKPEKTAVEIVKEELGATVVEEKKEEPPAVVDNEEF